VGDPTLEGHKLLGQGREAEIYEWADGQVLRLYRSAKSATRIEHEASAMRAAAERGVPAPQVFGMLTVDGRPGLLMERVDGADLITLLGRRPWTLFRAARMVGTTHAALHETRAPSDLEDLHSRIRRRLHQLPEALLPTHLRSFALHELDALPEGDRLCHGDFHPGNLLVTDRGATVIDWTAAARGDAVADVARTCLMLTVGVPEPSMPALIHRVQGFGRGAFVRSYLRAYRRFRSVDERLVHRWKVVRAADRLAEGIREEDEQLLAIVERAANEAD
jgi:aminoglycoside phosphotransferase (APT) family kinase protein